jgi:hypothetical protein
MDIICQAKSGMGKTAVFVLATLHQLEPTDGECHVLIMCHTRELAFQIAHEYQRFSKYLPKVKSAVFYGGTPIKAHKDILKGDDAPHILVGTPGRILALVKTKDLNLSNCKHFILDECDKMLEALGTPALPPAHQSPSCSHLRFIDPRFIDIERIKHSFSLTFACFWVMVQTCAVTCRRSSRRPRTTSK